MKRFTFQTIESEGLFDDYGRSFSKNEIQYGLTRKTRIRTEISLQNSYNLKKSIINDNVEDEIRKEIIDIQDKINQLKQRISQTKTAIENSNFKLQKIQEQIEEQEIKFKQQARLISEIIKIQNSSNKQEIDYITKKPNEPKNLQQKYCLESSIFEYNQELIKQQKLLIFKKKERQDIKESLQILQLRKVSQEQELQTLLKQENYKRENLLEYLYGQCNLQNTKGNSIIDIIRKVKQISNTFDSTKLPNELDQFERQYLVNKVNFEKAKKSTITLNESFSQKLKIKNTQSPIRLNYLKKIIGQDAYSYIPKLQDNPFREINNTNKKKKTVKAKSLENHKIRKCDCSVQTVLIK